MSARKVCASARRSACALPRADSAVTRTWTPLAQAMVHTLCTSVVAVFPEGTTGDGRADQPAEQRPVSDIGLGDEARLRTHRMHRRNVEPRHMIGRDQRGARPELPSGY